MLRMQSKPALVPLARAALGQLCLAAALISLAAPAAGAPVPDLYVAQVPATALSGAPLDEAFTQALGQVLVKVTGQRGIGADPARRRAIGPPAPLVRQYQPVSGGQVRVSFDPAALRRRLDAANIPVWADDRPLALVLLPPEPPATAALAGAPPAVQPVSDPAASPRQLLQAAALTRGIALVLASDPAGTGVGGDPLQDPDSALRGAGADVLLVGRPLGTAGVAALRWTLVQGTDRAEWQGDMSDGANGLADRLAARYATVAAATRSLRLRITGVDNFDAYGRLQSYLRSVGLIQSAELKEVNAGEMVFDLSVRGDARQLNDALALRRVLEPAGGEQSTGDLSYRLATAALTSGNAGESTAAP